MSSRAAFLVFVALGLVGCDLAPSSHIANSEPAAGSALIAFSIEAESTKGMQDYGPLIQLFCRNAFGSGCPGHIAARFDEFGWGWKGTPTDIAEVLSTWVADEQDGHRDRTATLEAFRDASYRVVLGRGPREDEVASDAYGDDSTRDRKSRLTRLLRSDEFRKVG